MNWDQVQGDWQQLKGKIREKWGQLTDQDVEKIGGAKDRLLGALKERYGYEKDKASKEIDDWVTTLERKIGRKDPP